MPRYINADALHSMVARALDINEAVAEVTDAVEQEHRVLYWLLEKIEEQSTVSPDEVRGVGKWTLSKDYPGYAMCSCCEDAFVDPEWILRDGKWNYCPNCGAKMGVC